MAAPTAIPAKPICNELTGLEKPGPHLTKKSLQNVTK